MTPPSPLTVGANLDHHEQRVLWSSLPLGQYLEDSAQNIHSLPPPDTRTEPPPIGLSGPALPDPARHPEPPVHDHHFFLPPPPLPPFLDTPLPQTRYLPAPYTSFQPIQPPPPPSPPSYWHQPTGQIQYSRSDFHQPNQYHVPPLANWHQPAPQQGNYCPGNGRHNPPPQPNFELRPRDDLLLSPEFGPPTQISNNPIFDQSIPPLAAIANNVSASTPATPSPLPTAATASTRLFPGWDLPGLFTRATSYFNGRPEPATANTPSPAPSPPQPGEPTTQPAMPTRKRSSGAAALDNLVLPRSSPAPSTPRKKRKVAAATKQQQQEQRPSSGQDPFDALYLSDSDEDPDIIDLRDEDKITQQLVEMQQKKANQVKLGDFQCAICMDDVSSLSLTHCGHLFCTDCLVSSLNIQNQKNKCPICRQKIEAKTRGAYKNTTKGFWPLELKLMTTTRRAASASASASVSAPPAASATGKTRKKSDR